MISRYTIISPSGARIVVSDEFFSEEHLWKLGEEEEGERELIRVAVERRLRKEVVVGVILGVLAGMTLSDGWPQREVKPIEFD